MREPDDDLQRCFSEVSSAKPHRFRPRRSDVYDRMSHRQIVLGFGGRIEFSFGCFAVVVKGKPVGRGDVPEHGVHRGDLVYVAQAELYHSEGALARSACGNRRNEEKERNRPFHRLNVRGTAEMRNVDFQRGSVIGQQHGAGRRCRSSRGLGKAQTDQGDVERFRMKALRIVVQAPALDRGLDGSLDELHDRALRRDALLAR